jgi:glycogen(starch) synthase
MVGERYGWATIARRTAAVYDRAAKEAPGFVAEQTATYLEQGRPSIIVPDGNLLRV